MSSKPKPIPEDSSPEDEQVHLPAQMPDIKPPSTPAQKVQFWCTFDVKSPQGKALALRCAQGGDIRGDSVLGNVLRVVNMYGRRAEFAHPETGEMMAFESVCFILDDNHIVSWGSDAIYRNSMYLFDPLMFGEPPWQPYLPLRVMQYKTRNAMTSYKVEVMADEIPKDFTSQTMRRYKH